MRILYIIIALAAFYLAFFQGEPVAFAALLLIAVMVGVDLYLGVKVRVSIKNVRKPIIARRKNSIFITFRIKNESKTPILKAKVKIKCKVGRQVFIKTLKSYIAPESSFDAKICLSSQNCTLVTAEVLSVKTGSIFFVFSHHIKIEPVRTVVIPEASYRMKSLPPFKEWEKGLQFIPQHEYSDVRVYRDGDSLSRIHLPLLAKHDELFSKEYKHESREESPQYEILCLPVFKNSDNVNDRVFGDTLKYAESLQSQGYRVKITLCGFEVSENLYSDTDSAETAMAILMTLFFAARDKNEKKRNN
ncbi:MAG: DUF58 domain-containing protein [Ruminococcus sp.]|jgi:uncharacterized protein (DUF58 family)|nr:DUF58 domain-containing protein [Ruminococcus sp.]